MLWLGVVDKAATAGATQADTAVAVAGAEEEHVAGGDEPAAGTIIPSFFKPPPTKRPAPEILPPQMSSHAGPPPTKATPILADQQADEGVSVNTLIAPARPRGPNTAPIMQPAPETATGGLDSR